jgi:hypothetical protein
MLLKATKPLFITFIMLIAVFFSAQAQQDDYRLNISRTFGYGNGSDIRGTFTLSIVGPGNIHSVKFLIDDQPIAELTADPFSYTFQTSQYPSGWHDLSAVIEKNDGSEISTPARRLNFVTAEQESSGMAGIIIPLLGGIVLVMVGAVALQALFFRNKPFSTLPLGASRNYGLRGGTICPKCRRPYALHWWAINIGFRNRVDRCEFCGKWSVVRPLSRTELDAATAAELERAQADAHPAIKTERDRLNEMIDNSRYTDQ